MKRSVQESFERGAYKDVVAETVDRDGWDLADVAYAVGALQFVGRIDDARTLFNLHARTMPGEARAAARFYLGIGFTRVSRYGEAREQFGANLLAARRGRPSLKATFYAWQGVAFYRFFLGRFGLALANARRAWDAAFAASYRHGQVLAADLRGHALVHSGEIAAGLQSLDEAFKFAAMLGHGGIQHALIVTRAIYRAAHGLGGEAGATALTELLETLPAEDSYSHSMLSLELARQSTLRGDLRRSEQHLERAGRKIYASGHRRLKAMLHHRLAYNRLLMGRPEAALAMIGKGEAELEPAIDMTLRLELLGLRVRLEAGSPDLERVIADLTARSSSGKARNILARRDARPSMRWGQEPWPSDDVLAPAVSKRTAQGDDAIADIKDLTAAGEAADAAAITAIVESGYLCFLHDVTPVPAGVKALYFDLLPGSLVTFDEGSVTMERRGVAPKLRHLAEALGRGIHGKRELVETVWGLDYHSLKHDPLLYQAIGRFRRLLGDRADWLTTSGDGYALAPGIRIFSGAASPGAAQPGDGGDSSLAPGLSAGDALNHRQLLILAHLKATPFINVGDCMTLYGVSRITALRDLSTLVDMGLLTRQGRGRATTYARR